MKKTFSRMLLYALLVACAVGCAGSNGYLPKHAITDPAEGISIPHPVEMEKDGVKAFTTFTAVMSPDLWTEVAAGNGVYPIIGQKPDGSLLKSYCYLADVNWWGDFLLQCVFADGRAELVDAKFVIFNRDAGWAYKLNGEEVYEPAESEDKKPFAYEPSKFDSDEKYRKEFFEKFGTTLKQSDEFFKSYFSEKGITPDGNLTSVNEVVVGSEKWESYKVKLASSFPFDYKLANGQIRSGRLPLEAFKGLAVEDPGFTGGARFARDTRLPLIALPLTGIAWPIMVGASIASSAAVAGVDDSWSGYYGRAKVIRHQLAPAFRQITAIYKGLLLKRDEVIKRLESEPRLQEVRSDLRLNP